VCSGLSFQCRCVKKLFCVPVGLRDKLVNDFLREEQIEKLNSDSYLLEEIDLVR